MALQRVPGTRRWLLSFAADISLKCQHSHMFDRRRAMASSAKEFVRVVFYNKASLRKLPQQYY